MEESFLFSQDQTQKKRYVGPKSDHYELSYEPPKFVRTWRGLLARGLSWTLNMRSFSHTDRILLPHISFFPPGPYSEKRALSLTVWPEIDLNWLSVWVWEWCPSMLILFSFSLRAPLQLSQIWLCRSCELFWHALRISNWSEVSFWYP